MPIIFHISILLSNAAEATGNRQTKHQLTLFKHDIYRQNETNQIDIVDTYYLLLSSSAVM